MRRLAGVLKNLVEYFDPVDVRLPFVLSLSLLKKAVPQMVASPPSKARR